MQQEVVLLMRLPALSLAQIDDMTLLEIEDRLKLLLELKTDQIRARHRELVSLIFYGVRFGYVASKSKKNIEGDFHKAMNKMFEKQDAENKTNSSPENDLASVFGV